jgi:hypothetical protein
MAKEKCWQAQPCENKAKYDEIRLDMIVGGAKIPTIRYSKAYWYIRSLARLRHDMFSRQHHCLPNLVRTAAAIPSPGETNTHNQLYNTKSRSLTDIHIYIFLDISSRNTSQQNISLPFDTIFC